MWRAVEFGQNVKVQHVKAAVKVKNLTNLFIFLSSSNIKLLHLFLVNHDNSDQ